MSRPFRFGVALRHTGGGRDWLDKARLAEELGYDVLLVADNPMMQAPFPALAAAAAVTSGIRLSPYVLNPAVRHPSMLVHELATLDRLTDGRLEIGLGLGNRQIDEIPLVGAGGRPKLLERLIGELQAAFAGDDPNTQFAQEKPPIFIAGVGPRLVEIAAASADTFLVSGAMPHPPGVVGPAMFDLETAERSYGRIRELAGDRIELGSALQELAITDDPRAAAEKVVETQFHLTVDQVLASPKAAFGTVEEIAEELRRRRESLGISYVVLPEPYMRDFLPIRELL